MEESESQSIIRKVETIHFGARPSGLRIAANVEKRVMSCAKVCMEALLQIKVERKESWILQTDMKLVCSFFCSLFCYRYAKCPVDFN